MTRSLLTALTALLLMCSGACALVYQVAWLRELHLVFGSTTASSAAVVAIFMGGLGIGNAVLGKRADIKQNALRYYAQLEICIAVTAALSPFLIDLTRWAYIGLGGQMALGVLGATLIRLLFSALVILLPTILMGGTLPAAVAAVTSPEDLSRRAVGLLYGLNTLGAVVGTIASTFLLLGWLGTRTTLWTACVLNVALAALAGLLSRSLPLSSEASSEAMRLPSSKAKFPPKSVKKEVGLLPDPRYVYASAAVVGFGFMLMELVWYRMLAPILGGTTYTFGLILAIALLGIGIGGAIYPLIFRRGLSPNMSHLSMTCGLEAVLIAVPFALGDRLAVQAAVFHFANTLGFFGEVLGWSAIALLIVLPASIVSGVQFPLLIALLGQAKKDVGKQLGYTYVANTLGSIIGSLAGGFGLLPLLSAPGAWRLVVGILVALSICLAVYPPRRKSSHWRLAIPFVVSLVALLLIGFTGPTAVWRHSGIGAGRVAFPSGLTPNNIHLWENSVRRETVWQTDGVEAGVAIVVNHSMGFYVNGKCDGNTLTDAGTQIGLGILPAILHPNPKTCLVVGLGTGETAGWLAEVSSVNQVDAVEIEPAVKEIARRSASVNCNVLTNPKVRLIFNDAREVLLTTNDKYDIISSEPSNPYRAGIANLFTREFYLSVAARLNRGGLFVQWLQGYEIDETTAATAFATLRSVFKNVEVWQSGVNDMILVCSQDYSTDDLAGVRRRMQEEPFRRGFAEAWRATQIEGLLARYVGGNALTEEIAIKYGNFLNTDDLNRLEYGFARTLGRKTDFTVRTLREKAASLSAHRPNARDTQIDWEAVEDECITMFAVQERRVPIPPGASAEQIARGHAFQRYLDKDYADAVAQWESQTRQATYPTETAILALAYAELGNEKAAALIDRLRPFNRCEAELIRGILLVRQGRNSEASAVLCEAFLALRSNPWPMTDVVEHALLVAGVDIAYKDTTCAKQLLQTLEEPFAALYMDHNRKWTGCYIASWIGTRTLLPWIESYEPNVVWTEEFLDLRVKTYAATRHPLAERAASDLQLFRSQEGRNY